MLSKAKRCIVVPNKQLQLTTPAVVPDDQESQASQASQDDARFLLLPLLLP